MPYIVRKINNKIYNGNTHSLVEATRQGREELVRQILDNGANINSQDRNGMSSLMFAAKNGDTEMVRLLLNYNPDLNLNEFNTGNTAILLAKKNNHREVVELLKKAGATE